MGTKFERFVIALRNLCAEHEVVLRAPGSDILVIDADAPDADLVRAAVFDATKDEPHG